MERLEMQAGTRASKVLAGWVLCVELLVPCVLHSISRLLPTQLPTSQVVYIPGLVCLVVRARVTRQNTGHPIEFEFQINNV